MLNLEYRNPRVEIARPIGTLFITPETGAHSPSSGSSTRSIECSCVPICVKNIQSCHFVDVPKADVALAEPRQKPALASRDQCRDQLRRRDVITRAAKELIH